MRLSTNQAELLVLAVSRLDKGALVYLFGSRVRDDLKGGDFDFLIVSDLLGLTQKLDLIIEFKKILGDQKIDLKIIKRSDLPSDPFAKSILTNAVLLQA